jgi:hypothetical protein
MAVTFIGEGAHGQGERQRTWLSDLWFGGMPSPDIPQGSGHGQLTCVLVACLGWTAQVVLHAQPGGDCARGAGQALAQRKAWSFDMCLTEGHARGGPRRWYYMRSPEEIAREALAKARSARSRQLVHRPIRHPCFKNVTALQAAKLLRCARPVLALPESSLPAACTCSCRPAAAGRRERARL